MDEGDMKIEEAPSDEEKVPEEQVYMDTYIYKHFPSFPTLTWSMNTNPKNPTHDLLSSLTFKQLTRVPIAVVDIPEDDKEKENAEVWSHESL